MLNLNKQIADLKLFYTLCKKYKFNTYNTKLD